MKERVIMHIDLDAFFAACEENRRPEIKGKPVVVGADPKRGKGRGVVSTCNYPARKYGIRSGMPITWAYRRCAYAVFLPVDMELYGKTSRRVMHLFKKYAKKFEQTSVDEAFLDVSHIGYEKSEKLSREIKKGLKEMENLTCSIGIAPNMLLAKIASEFQKPNGLTTVRPYEVKMFLYTLPVRALLWVGPKMEVSLKKIGINTIGRLASTPKEKLERYFGKWGLALHREAQGKDEREVGTEWEAKSISRQATFAEDVSEKKKLQKALESLVEEVLDDARASKVKFRTVTVKVRYEDFDTHTKQRKFKSTLNKKDAKAWARELLKPFLKDERKIRLLGFGVSDLVFPRNSHHSRVV